MHHPSHVATHLEHSIESIHVAVWAAIGAVMGWLATQLKPAADRIVFVENIVVAVFGAFIGGEAVAAMLRAGPKDTAITLVAVVLAMGCSAIALLLLGMMRRSVGPLRSGKPKPRR